MLIPLTVTSFDSIKKRMNATTWKALQRWSYAFFILSYVHAICFLLVPAMSVADTAMLLNISLYSVIIVSYCIMRIRRAILDKSERPEQASA
jgi:DMSO/TMAO reductase YedYZ heme-binding membrane subunit